MDDIITVVGGFALVVAVIALILVLAALFFLLAWNVGVVGIAAALGYTVGKISFWVALGGAVAVNIIGGIFKRSTIDTSKK